MAIILVIMAGIMIYQLMNKADTITDRAEVDDVQMIEPVVFRFVDQKHIYDFCDDQLMVWTDCTEEDSVVYNVSVFSESDEKSVLNQVVFEPQINLGDYDVNPGSYMIIVKNRDRETIKKSFSIQKPEYLLESAPNFELEHYNYHVSEPQPIKWFNDSNIAKINIIDISSGKTLHSLDVEQNHIDLKMLNLPVGTYWMSAQLILEDKKSIFDYSRVTLLNDEAVKGPIMITKDLATLTSDGYLEWLPVKGELYVKWIHQSSDFTYEVQFTQGEDEMALKELGLPEGEYVVVIQNLIGNRSSEILKYTISILAK